MLHSFAIWVALYFASRASLSHVALRLNGVRRVIRFMRFPLRSSLFRTPNHLIINFLQSKLSMHQNLHFTQQITVLLE